MSHTRCLPKFSVFTGTTCLILYVLVDSFISLVVREIRGRGLLGLIED
jgi:hypothetical protein